MSRIAELSPSFALHILDRMGSIGQPPERGARFVNVGTDDILDLLRDEYLRPMKASGRNSTFKLVQATFGGGKTHFLHCLRELAWTEGFSTALVGLSPKECPFDRPVLIYQAVARRIEYPVEDLEEAPHQGIASVLRQIAHQRVEENGTEAFLEWLRDEFAEHAVESAAIHRAVRIFLEATVGADRDKAELIGDFLCGEKMSGDELAPFKLRETLGDENAFRWLRALVQCLSALGMPGVVLMFDEMDRNVSLGVRRRRDIGDNLRQMIDYCGQSLLPGVLWCYAVPPEFMDTIVPEYPALAQRLKGASQFSTLSPLQPIIDLERLPLTAYELQLEIGMRLLELAERGTGYRFDRVLQRTNLQALSKAWADRQLEAGARREFVKAAVALLEKQRRGGPGSITAADLEVRTAPAPAPTLSLPGEDEF